MVCRVQFSGTRQRSYLPSAKKTLGKKNTRQTSYLPSIFFLALGKDALCQMFFLALSKEVHCRVFLALRSANKIYKAHFEAVN
jgi:hypothetical protein